MEKYSFDTGPRQRPQRVVLYGPEGIGKSTLAALMPGPVFVDVEDGTAQLDVTRVTRPTTWQVLVDEVRWLATCTGLSTVVVDTLDAAETLCQAATCRAYGKANIEDFGYGKGYTYARDTFRELLDALDTCVAAGLNVVCVAHSAIRKFERPDEAGAYDRFEPKLDKRVAALVKEWCDALLFVDYETYVTVDQQGRAKASGGARVIRTEHSPVWDAKNRWGLPEKIAFDGPGAESVACHLVTRADTVPATEDRPELPAYFAPLVELMDRDHVSVKEMDAAMELRHKRTSAQPFATWEPEFVQWAVSQWDGVLKAVAENRDMPF